MEYRPEGCLFMTESNQKYLSSAAALKDAMKEGIILEAKAILCTSSHDLVIGLPCGKGLIPREEGAVGIKEGTVRDIALISRVNKPVCFKVCSVSESPGGVIAILSRRAAQEECISSYIRHLVPGDIIDARVTHLEKFGCFADIGCGIPSLMPIDAISVSRISHPSDRFRTGEMIRAAVRSREGERVSLTQKELLGTWEENAAGFHAGETVPGIVRSVEEYGVFVELTPNLAGLAELKENIRPGQSVSVYIKAVIPEKMKIKLVIVDVCDDEAKPAEPVYFYNGSHISEWIYSSAGSQRRIAEYF